jgi:copper(I)-binding protein
MTHRLIALAIAALTALTAPALAEDFRAGDLTVEQPWARASASLARAGAAYLSITNQGTRVDRLLRVASPVAKRASLHTHLMKDGIMRMRPVKAIEVDPGAPTVLKPGGLHIMLMGLKGPLKEGTMFLLTLTFETAGTVEVRVMVRKAGAMGPGHGHGHGKGGKGS